MIRIETSDSKAEELNTDAVGQINLEKIEKAITLILEAIGEDVERDGLRDTPGRVARMYAEVFAGLHGNPAEELSARFDVESDGVVIVRDIPFYSMCEHHLLPFFGVVHVAYLPDRGQVTGLSKLARLVDIVARRPQIQERMTETIAQTISEELGARGVMVVANAEHLCMSMRGVEKPGSRTMTVATRGVYRDSAGEREEVLHLLRT